MAGKTRRLDIVIAGEDRSAGKTFKNVADDADRLGGQLKAAGRKAGQQFSSGLDSGVDKNGLASKMRGFGETASGAFKGAMLAGGVAAGALFVGGLLQELDNEFATDKLVAQLGGSEWAGEMGKIAGDLYVENFGDSIADVGAVLKSVLQQGLLSEDASNEEIQDLTRQVLTFSDVLDQDAAGAVRALSSILKSGLAKDGSEALDILTRGVQQGADKAEDLLDTFTEYSTMFREIGLDAVSATGLLVQGLRHGARDADTVADALKEFAIRAQDASTTSAEGFKAIGLSAEEMTRKVAAGGPEAREALDLVLDGLRNMEDPVARNAAAVALFGTKAEDLGDALFSMDLQGYSAGLGDVEGSTDDLATAYDNAKSKIETFKREAMEKLTTFIGEEVIPRLEDFGEWVGKNQDTVEKLGVALGIFVGTALLAYIINMGIAAAATIAATWPILAIIGAIVGLGAGLAWIVNQDWFSGFLQWWIDLADAVGDVIPLIETAMGLLPRIGDALPFGLGPSEAKVDPLADLWEKEDAKARYTRPLKPIFADGGVMPGMRGVHSLAWVAGGETIVPTHDPSAMRDWTSNMVAASSGGGTIRVEIPVVLDGREIGRSASVIEGMEDAMHVRARNRAS